LPNRKNYL